MVNIFKTLASIPVFGVSLFVAIISVTIFTTLESIMTGMGFTAINDVMWFLIFIVWILLVIGVPGYFYYTGIVEKNNKGSFSNSLLAGMIFIFGLALLYEGWNMIMTVMDAVQSAGSNILYTIAWISLIGFIIAWLIGLPAALYIEAQSIKNQGGELTQ